MRESWCNGTVNWTGMNTVPVSQEGDSRGHLQAPVIYPGSVHFQRLNGTRTLG